MYPGPDQAPPSTGANSRSAINCGSAVDALDRGDGFTAAWLRTVAVGDQLGFTGFRTDYADPPGTGLRLLVGDRSAVPALRSILDRSPAGTPVLVLTETEPAWLGVQPPDREVRGNLDDLPAATRALGRLDPDTRVWVAAEHTTTARTRQVLLAECGVPPARVDAKSYWQQGLTWEEMFDASLLRFQRARSQGLDVTDPGVLQEWEFTADR